MVKGILSQVVQNSRIHTFTHTHTQQHVFMNLLILYLFFFSFGYRHQNNKIYAEEEEYQYEDFQQRANFTHFEATFAVPSQSQSVKNVGKMRLFRWNTTEMLTQFHNLI